MRLHNIYGLILLLSLISISAHAEANKCGDKNSGVYLEFFPSVDAIFTAGMARVDIYQDGQLVKAKQIAMGMSRQSSSNFSLSIGRDGAKTSRTSVVGILYFPLSMNALFGLSKIQRTGRL